MRGIGRQRPCVENVRVVFSPVLPLAFSVFCFWFLFFIYLNTSSFCVPALDIIVYSHFVVVVVVFFCSAPQRKLCNCACLYYLSHFHFSFFFLRQMEILSFVCNEN